MFMWGSATYHKMGLGKMLDTIDQPVQAEWTMEKAGFYTETGKPAMRNQLVWLDPKRPKDHKKSDKQIS